MTDDLAAQLGLELAMVSVAEVRSALGWWAHAFPCLARTVLVVSPAQLLALIDRAETDPAWYDRLATEVVMEALAG